MKMTFICSACKKSTDGWLFPISEEEIKADPILTTYREKRLNPPPIVISFTGRTETWPVCSSCHEKFASFATTWLKNGLMLIEPEQKSEE